MPADGIVAGPSEIDPISKIPERPKKQVASATMREKSKYFVRCLTCGLSYMCIRIVEQWCIDSNQKWQNCYGYEANSRNDIRISALDPRLAMLVRGPQEQQ
jgi:hypothetical protein